MWVASFDVSLCFCFVCHRSHVLQDSHNTTFTLDELNKLNEAFERDAARYADSACAYPIRSGTNTVSIRLHTQLHVQVQAQV
jgi:hypothetical protein